MKDRNGLELSNLSDSGYQYVTVLFSGEYAGKYIAYANVPSDMRDMDHGEQRKFFGYKNIQGLEAFDDVRDAAKCAQDFCRNLRQNLIDFWAGKLTLRYATNIWEHEPAETSTKRILEARERHKLNIKKSRQPFTELNALQYYFQKDPKKYHVHPYMVKDMIAELKRMECKDRNELLNAAVMVLDNYIK